MKKSTWAWTMVSWFALAGAGCGAGGSSDGLSSSGRGGSSGTVGSIEEAGATTNGSNADDGRGGAGQPASNEQGGGGGGGGGARVDNGTGGRGAGVAAGGGASTSGVGGRATPGGTGGRTVAGGSGGRVSTGGAGAIAGSSGLGTAGMAGGGAGATSPAESNGLTIYYIRHAETVANINDAGPTTGEGAEEFTPLGQRQVDALTEYLSGSTIVPDAVLVSPTWRTQKTIEPYMVAKDLTGEIWMELDECCATPPTGGALPTEPKFYQYWKASVVAENLALREPKGNLYWQNITYEDGLFMVMTARDLLLSRFSQSGKTLIMVGHAVAGSILIGLLQGNDLKAGPDQLGRNRVFMLNTGVQKLVQDVSTGLFKVEGSNVNKPDSK